MDNTERRGIDFDLLYKDPEYLRVVKKMVALTYGVDAKDVDIAYIRMACRDPALTELPVA